MANRDFSAEIEAIRKDVNLLRDDLGALVGALGDDLESRGEAARDAVQRRVSEAQTRARSTLDDLEQTLERNPLSALATALGIGFLIGALFTRR